MAASLPTFPRVIFTIVEPISLVAGFLGAVIDPNWFMSEQIPRPMVTPSSVHSRAVTLQLGNLYLLLAMIGVAVLYSTSEIKVVRNFLVALWIADIGHVWICYLALGYDVFIDVVHWNATTWGNVGVTVFLCLTRTLYFLGFFGSSHGSNFHQVKKSN